MAIASWSKYIPQIMAIASWSGIAYVLFGASSLAYMLFSTQITSITHAI